MTRRDFFRTSAGATASVALAQQRPYDLIIKNGELRDPSSSLRRRADLAVIDGKIAAIEDNIPAERAFDVIDAKGLYVTPGTGRSAHPLLPQRDRARGRSRPDRRAL